ncbi:phage tail protein [Burkholderia ubonensis]|uniref:phage tail protein n=1 Tax=Burkholderia ubonensis TaxID=101571 RepID=UPI000756401F|nr:phage tail protein [Burkholderia ubonensis]KVZ75963.1 phage tail protein [Burkholderia ubonensis]KWE16496.1 phage tail protein [Burkholderia ubonensis]
MATQILITDAGRAALVAPGNGGTSAHQVVEIGLANAPFVADKGLTKLPNELKRITTFGGANIAPDTIHATLKDDTADQYSLYGFGLYLENGVLLAAYGQATPIMEKSPAALLLLSTDMQFATIDATQLVFGDASFLNPPATTERQGVVELATQAEVDAGADDTRAVTPKTAAKRYASLAGATFSGDVWIEPGKRLILAEGSLTSPSLTFVNDGTSDSGLYHNGDGQFGVTCNGASVLRFTPTLAAFDQPVTGPTPAQGDRSTRLATTEWVLAALSTTTIGQIVFEPRTTVRAGFLKANGVLLNRADYPGLWAYAQASGALVSDADWGNSRWGCFSTGDGTTTFRLPEMRGEFIRCWADGRGDTDPQRAIGSWQESANRLHAHGAGASPVGDHAHGAWSDGAGFHGHGVVDHGHVHGVNDAWTNQPGGDVGSSVNARNSRVGTTATPSLTGIGIAGDGHHVHNIGTVGAGAHNHVITVNADGSNESRPRNIALLAMIRAY